MSKKKLGEWPVAVLFLAPFLAVYLLFMIYPIFKGLYTSMCNVNIDLSQTFVGAANYKTMFGDKYFWESMGNTFFYALINTPSLVLVGLALALIVNSRLRGNVFFRGVYFMPYVLSISVVVYIWKFIFQPYNGLLNTTLASLGMSGQIMWLKDPNLVWWSVVIMTAWSGVGFNMVMFLAGLQEIDDNLYEAAMIDGAGSFARFWHITLPGLRNITLMITVLQTMASLKLFSHTYLLTKGGPGTQTRSIVHYIYEKAFVENELGVASAMSYALLVVMLILSVIQFRIGQGKDGRKQVEH